MAARLSAFAKIYYHIDIDYDTPKIKRRRMRQSKHGRKAASAGWWTEMRALFGKPRPRP